MTLNDDLAAWVNDRPDWQKDAVAQFCRNETLSETDINRIIDQIISGTYPSSSGISAEDIPGATVDAEPVTLDKLSGVKGVNALLEEQSLSFAKEGMTVIFGNNGAGKSGYARLLREAVTARVQGETLLGNVFARSRQEQNATLTYMSGNDAGVWKLGEARNHSLARVRFFDDKCGSAYVTQASEVDYQPSALTILDQLSDAVTRVSTALGQRMRENEAKALKLPSLREGTSAAAFFSRINALTTEDEIIEATTLDSDHDEQLNAQLEEASRLRLSDPNTEKQRLLKVSKAWQELEKYGTEAFEVLGSEGVSELRAKRTRTQSLRQAARIASQNSFVSEPLTHVGSETWRALWEAARDFSVSEAYSDHEYPCTESEAVCVLCQQPLSDEASDRLTRFEEFVKDTTSTEADSAENELARMRSRISALETIPVSVMTAVTTLQDNGELVSEELEYFQAASATAAKLISWLENNEETEPKPLGLLSNSGAPKASQLKLEEANSIDRTTFSQILTHQTKCVQELQDSKTLSEAQAQLVVEVQRLKELERIKTARGLCATNSITTKRIQLVEEYVTDAVKAQFAREIATLNLDRVTINRTGKGRDQALKHQPQLEGVMLEAGVHKVFSEGEQTALGLAGFLTEVELDTSYSGVVFDDPVSSLDAKRRSKVAKRLIQLAKERQVIVFTHEITFIHALLQEAELELMDVAPRTIQRVGGRHPGKVSAKFPWQVKDVPQRIHGLREDLSALKKNYRELTDEEYASQSKSIAGDLSETLERAIHIHIVNELVDRGANQVRPSMVKILPRFSEEDNREYQAFYGKISGWAPRHDNAPEENYHPPSINELDEVIEWLHGWHKRIKSYANN